MEKVGHEFIGQCLGSQASVIYQLYPEDGDGLSLEITFIIVDGIALEIDTGLNQEVVTIKVHGALEKKAFIDALSQAIDELKREMAE